MIPLSSAPAYPNGTQPPEKKEILNTNPDEVKSLERAPSSENGSAGSLPDTSYLNIELLRAEIEAEAAASGHDSMYDRMCRAPIPEIAGPQSANP